MSFTLKDCSVIVFKYQDNHYLLGTEYFGEIVAEGVCVEIQSLWRRKVRQSQLE